MFNTLKYTKKLEAIGMSREHAEAQIEIFAETIEDDVATKRDLKELELRLTFKLGAMMAIIAGLTVAAIGLMLS